MAFEAIQALIRLGEPAEDIWALVDGGEQHHECSILSLDEPSSKLKANLNPPWPKQSDFPWIRLWFDALVCTRYGDFKAAIQYWLAFDRLYPNCLVALLGLGRSYFDIQRWDDSEAHFERAHKQDHFCTDLMDIYASVLKYTGAVAKLNHLSHELVMAAPMRSEPWVSVALYCEVQSEREKAMEFIDRSLEFDPMHAQAYIVKGELAMAYNQPEDAITAFFHAYNFQKVLIC